MICEGGRPGLSNNRGLHVALAAAALRAIFYVFPIALPFLTPGKSTQANRAHFTGQIRFFHYAESSLLKSA